MVYFVGAGTGAADLITVRGMRLIGRADVIIYAGSLVNPKLLAYAGRECRIYNSATLTLEEVIQVMSDAEAAGKTVVRLHTGEPSIYGAVREQMDELDRRGIAYESCPGVSACFGAASSLNLEYTLPGISQSLIITRMEGRTKVPEMERIELLAAHRASMAIYLSAGMMEELSRRLLAGGYQEDTPAALVYKATWRDEEAYLCTVGTLPDVAGEHGITRMAIVLVGDAIAHRHYEKSRLYAADFSTGYRQGKDAGQVLEQGSGLERVMEQGSDVQPPLLRESGKKTSCLEMESSDRGLGIISFTEEGRKLSLRIAQQLAKEGWTSSSVPVEASVHAWAKKQMDKGNALLFIGACGIAVRAVAPWLKDKLSDVPVVVLDEKGRYAIPLLSGHMGGANELAHFLAGKIGAIPVITTATDLNGAFAVDVFAKKNGLHIANRDGIARVSAKALAGKPVTLSLEPGHCACVGTQQSEEPINPGGVQLVPYPPKQPVDVVVSSEEHVFEAALLLRPKEYVLGIGCKRGKKEEEIAAFVSEKIRGAGILENQIAACASISQKQDEPGILAWCRKRRIPFFTYTAQELQRVPGDFQASDFVREQVGVDNVCERAALKACTAGGVLVMGKCAANGMTIAIARREWRVAFDES